MLGQSPERDRDIENIQTMIAACARVGIPAFKYKGILLWFAAFPDHCSLFPKASTIEAFKDELKGYSTSKGTIRFPVDQPLPAALVKKIVKARVAQNEKKKRG